MRNRIQHLARDEQGMSFVFIGVSMMAFIAATTLAIDVGMFMNARTQSQNAADAGALAGATALVFNDYNNRTASGPAVQSARNSAMKNKVIGAAPSVYPTDVTFPLGPTGLDNRVKVTVYRTGAHGNAIPTLMGSLFGVDMVDIGATATAEASPANAMTCVKPFMIPDRWQENKNPPWDTDDTFDMYDNKGKLLTPHDVYVPATDKVNYTGYKASRDVGMLLMLRAGTGQNINPSFYFSWKMPGDTGGNFYRNNIANCNQSMVHWNDFIIQEPGNMVGPTNQGIDDLVAKDPNAYWDTGCKCVKGSAFAISPRIFPIPLYDPAYYADGKANGRNADFRVANFLGFFALPRSGNTISGHITSVIGVIDNGGGPAPDAAFPVSIRLVQ